MLAELETQQTEALLALEAAGDTDALEAWRISWLGTKGRLKGLMGRIKDVPPEDRKAFGQHLNALKDALADAFAARQAGGGEDAAPLDVTEPGCGAQAGRRHVITSTIDAILEVFGRMGFTLPFSYFEKIGHAGFEVSFINGQNILLF